MFELGASFSNTHPKPNPLRPKLQKTKNKYIYIYILMGINTSITRPCVCHPEFNHAYTKSSENENIHIR